MENLEEYEGKTIEKINQWDTGIEIVFTDGSTLEITSWGTEDHCITVIKGE